ncbi:unnamed protein product [Notodromas monacha]|uniref:RanBP2-type domain-containing protein n=1 Tax=Notodromas monacha TaxID=399045 RepID=A0A7R9GEM7_9CRUS|nr:unnamed protein product [Notodromas monacha]CAG0918427.1 unnamed protein product [Notodromas monacha]
MVKKGKSCPRCDRSGVKDFEICVDNFFHYSVEKFMLRKEQVILHPRAGEKYRNGEDDSRVRVVPVFEPTMSSWVASVQQKRNGHVTRINVDPHQPMGLATPQRKARLLDQVQLLSSGEETRDALDEKRNFEYAIEDFLSVTPHESKFSFPVIAEMFGAGLRREEFNGSKFTSAWEQLSKYAMNLLSRPWRTEYRTLKMYSGFFKHYVETQIPDAYKIFEILGYVAVPGEQRCVWKLNGPIDPDYVIAAYLDCVIAMVECRMMMQIVESVKDLRYPWSDVMSIRERYVCGVEEASRIVRHEVREEQASSRRLPEPPFYRGTVFHNPNFDFEPTTGVLVDLHSPPAVPSEVRKTPKFPVEPEDNTWGYSYESVRRKPAKKLPKPSSDVVSALKSLKFSSDQTDGKKSSAGKWSCHACTYLNPPETDICSMCSKSCVKGAEEKPLSVGGKECLRCTYVNDRYVDKCVICQDSLLNCPTYT